MSNVESVSASQRLLNEAANRLGEQSSSLGLPRLVAIDNLQGVLADARKRVRDSHAVQMKSLGHEVKDEGDDVGISVAGDTHITMAAPERGNAVLKTVLPWALAAIAGPIAGFIAARYFDKPAASTQPPAVSVPDSAYDVLFFDKDGQPINVKPLESKP